VVETDQFLSGTGTGTGTGTGWSLIHLMPSREIELDSALGTRYPTRVSFDPGDGRPRAASLSAVARWRRRFDMWRGREIGIRCVELGTDRLFVDTVDRYAAALAWKHGWRDAAAQRLIAREVRPGMVAVDVGANVGCYTLSLARRVGGDGRVYALEPEARCFELLCRATGGGRCVQVEARQLAAGEYSGWTSLYVAGTDHGDHRVVPAAEERRVVAVRAVSLDDLLADTPRVDFIKLAVQGAEVSALRGLRRTLARQPALRLLCAVSPSLLERSGCGADALFGPLREAGLTPHRLRHDGTAEPVHPAVAWSMARAAGRVLLYFRRLPGV
jgi:FkbM family methyltransferase